MPKRAENTLTWSAEHQIYQLCAGGQAPAPLDEAAWIGWLEEHGACSFLGQAGRLHLLKERRRAGPGYWYAYRRQGAQIAKRYAGRSADLTFARLEQLAQELSGDDVLTRVPQLPEQQPARMPAADPGAAPLLAPKLQPPRLQRALIRRERLLALLDAGRERKLTLLSAPAGFGKTTLLRQWLVEIADRSPAPAVAWLALEHGDNDPLRFWRYVMNACRAFGADVGRQALALVEAPLAIKSSLEMILTVFLNELAQVERESILVLEDYHAITAAQIHEMLGALLDHLPRQLHLVIITRTQPPLPLARLSAAGEIAVLEAPELRFSSAEAAAFLRQSTAHVLRPDDIALVESRLEGWAAGLRMLTLALEGRDDAGDIERILGHFIAGSRGIGEYFVAEVLSSQPAPLQLFLLQTSFLTRLSAALCDSVTEGAAGQAMLELLEQSNLFIEPLDELGQWYRYHALFASAMQAEARRRLGERAVCELQARASRWYEGHDMLPEAIEMAFAAQQPERAADLIERSIAPPFSLEHSTQRGPLELYALHSWLDRLPQSMLADRPLLNLALASAMLFAAIVEMLPNIDLNSAEIDRLFVTAEHGFSKNGDTQRLGQVLAFRALLLRERGELMVADRWARKALDLLPPHELNWRSMCMGVLALGEQHAGQLDAAAALLLEAQSLCEQAGNRPLARANAIMLGMLWREQNQIYRAAQLLREVQAEAEAISDIDDMANTLRGLAEIALCWNDLDLARSQAEAIDALMRQYPHEPDPALAGLLLARVELAGGQGQAALARCAALIGGREAARSLREKQLLAQIMYEQAAIALACGELLIAQRWRSARRAELELPRIQRDHEAILLARLQVAEGAVAEAVQALESLLAIAEAEGREQIALEIQVPLALARAALGQPQAARQTLVGALARAQPCNSQHVFLVEGKALVALLRSSLPSLAETPLLPFARTILRSLAPAERLPASGLLSPQEQRVLGLIAAGRSTAQIAAELVVSVNTAKVHIKSIYRKLQVGSRLEAVNAARELGLLAR